MTREERILSYSRSYERFAKALKEMPEAMWNFKPAPEKWSVHEIIIHMADSEANSYCRARKFICEPGSIIMAYNQDAWAERTAYAKQSTSGALELFRLLREQTYYVIKDLPEETWQHKLFHPENGEMTMDDWLRVYDEHVDAHIRQMNRNLESWQKRKF